MQFKTVISSVAAAAICLAVVKQAQPSTTQAPDSLDRFIVQRMGQAGIVGLGAAIIVDKKVVWMKGYGFADRERAVPFTPDVVMNFPTSPRMSA